MINFVGRSGLIYNTSLSVDEAGLLASHYPEWYFYLNHTFSCYEDCSVSPCLGSLCPN